MGGIALSLAALVLALPGGARLVGSHGVRLTVPDGWSQVVPTPSAIVDALTVLVVGTLGVRDDLTSSCQVAAYRVPARGAVVVVVAWRTATSGGGHLPPGRARLRKLRAVSRPSFECYSGRGAAEQVVLGGKAYQVNVLVGDRASRRLVTQALVVARSFDLLRR